MGGQREELFREFARRWLIGDPAPLSGLDVLYGPLANSVSRELLHEPHRRTEEFVEAGMFVRIQLDGYDNPKVIRASAGLPPPCDGDDDNCLCIVSRDELKFDNAQRDWYHNVARIERSQ